MAAVDDLAPLLIGRDPRDIQQAVQTMTRHSYYRMGIIGTTAVSGIEHALWDIFGKSLGVPVWRLLGGAVRSCVRVYAHLGLGDMGSVYDSYDPVRVADLASAVVAQGYDALKVVLVPFSGYVTRAAQRRLLDSLMSAVRGAVGADVDIMVDFHGRPESVSAAMDYIRVVAPFDVLFCEEPVQPGDAVALAAIAQQAPCAIAAGERLIGLGEFLPVLQARAVHIAQPDLNHTGGLLEGKRIAAAAEAHMVGVAPHNPNGPIASAAALHFAVSTPNFVIQEEMSGAVPWYDDVVSGPTVRKGSSWDVPTTPGLGIEVDEKEVARHPYEAETMHQTGAVLDDGTIAHW
jgi:galactonate dehydratase